MGGAVEFWIAVLGGGAVWLITFLLLPKPMWVYVVGHELTHAVWAWLFGARLKSFKASAQGGHVVVSKTNFLITLAPYFFPLYTIFWAVGFLLVDFMWPTETYEPLFHFGLGLTYAFHVTLTASVLRIRQPDIVQEGWLFSGVVIWLGNLSALLLALPVLTRHVGLLTALGWAVEETGRVVGWLGRLL